MREKEKIEHLLDLEDNWMDREAIDVDLINRHWIEEGIELYKRFTKLDPKEPRYAIMLADLYLKWGVDEKVQRGNMHSAYEILRLSTIHAPKKPEAFYRLSFLLANENRRWEAALFYGKEAIENGIEENQKIKLLCNMSLAYQRIGYPYQSIKCLLEAKQLDKINNQDWFIKLYEDKRKVKRTEPILLSSSENSRENIARKDYDDLKEKAMEGECIVLDLSQDRKHFYAIADAVALEKTEAEILGFLMDHEGIPCSKQKIEEAVW
ncbi:hypothetical protein [Planococcus sp. YIM B11945]|uniref:hypothetical protein n=1 Tax=Planococcus sp. YIM B11945 TaxID=3435410 RepID=UPI003D7CD253